MWTDLRRRIIIIAMKRMKFERRQLRRHSDVTQAVKARVQDLSDCVNEYA